MQKSNDQDVRDKALNTSESFIVQAPAGSGKTTLLTKRLLKLLSEVEKAPEECLAITFTRKAAHEMRERLLNALESAVQYPEPNQLPPDRDPETWRLAKELLKRDKEMNWNLNENPSRLRIQTVDALCASITRQMPIVSQFGTGLTIAEDPEPLYRAAARNLFMSLETKGPLSNALSTLLSHMDNNLDTAERLLAEMLSIREQWLPYIGLTAKQTEARKALEQGLQTAIGDILHKLLLQIPKTLSMGSMEILILANYAAAELISLNIDSPICRCQALNSSLTETDKISSPGTLAWPDSSLTSLPIWQGLAELLLTEKQSFRKTVTQNQGFKAPSQASNKEEKQVYQLMKQRMLNLLAELEQYSDFRSALEDLRECPAATYSNQQWEIVESLVQVLPELVAQLMCLFQTKGQVDFAEVLLSASRALGEFEEPSDLALKLDCKIKHILVDEFQDISIPQLKLLEKLTQDWQPGEGRTLFLVGDPQQSIYRFRQADVGLFLQAREKGLGNIPLQSLQLTVNFRSSPKIIDWVNQTFSKTFPRQDEPSQGAIRFSSSVAALEESDNDFVEVETRELTMESEGQQIYEGQQIIELVNHVKNRDALGSIALLVRSRRHLKSLLPLLKQQGIAYQGLDIERLQDHPLLRDLLALTLALLHLGDRIAWLSLLRSPYCSLSLTDLFIIANHESQLPLWWTLQSWQQLPGLSQEAIKQLSNIIPCLKKALEERDRYPLAVWIKETWLNLLNAALIEDLKLLYREESFDTDQVQERFFAILEAQGYSTEFYDRDLLVRALDQLFAKSEDHNPEAVQVMTIHKAKGLEFDTVIVAGIGRSTRSDTEKLLLWESRVSLHQKPYLILAPIKPSTKIEEPIYRFIKKENKKRAQFEEQRLLYVASTRAKKRLYWLKSVF